MALDYKNSRWGRVLLWLIATIIGRILWLMFKTCRVTYMDPKVWDFFDRGQSGVLLTWHRAAIFFLGNFGNYHPAIMISRSNDGEILSGFLKALGGIPVRGSSSGGGMAALRQMAVYITGGPRRYAGTVADGPRGPRYKAKDGMIRLSCHTSLPLAPVMWSARRCWCLKGTWDKTAIPKPFAKVYVDFGAPRSYLPNLSREQIELARQELEAELIAMKDNLDAISGYEDPA